MKVIDGSYSEWRVGRLAWYSGNLTLKNVNISFNHLSYYLINRGDSRVVAQVDSLGDEAW